MITHSVFDPSRATPVFGELGQILPGSAHSSSWWKQRVKGLYSREGNMEGVTNLILQSPSVFFLCFSCLSSHTVVILRVRWQQEHPMLLKRGCFCSCQSSRIMMRLGSHQLSVVWHRAAESQAFCFPQCSNHWQSQWFFEFFFFFAISLGRNLSLVLQTMLPLREWCFSWHTSSCPNCWQSFHLGRCCKNQIIYFYKKIDKRTSPEILIPIMAFTT